MNSPERRRQNGILQAVLVSLVLIGAVAVLCSCKKQAPEPVNFDAMLDTLAEDMLAEWQAEIEALADPAQIEAFSKQTFTDDTIRELYRQYQAALVPPPHPDSQTYAIENSEDALKRTRELATTFHNMIQGMPQDAYDAYGMILSGMREVLFLNYKHIPLAIEGNRSRDVIWWELHQQWSAAVKEIYESRFATNTEIVPPEQTAPGATNK